MRNPSISLLAALLLASLAAPVHAQDGRGLPPPERGFPPGYAPLPAAVADSVRSVMRGYLDAVRRHDGAAGAQAVTRATRAYYAQLHALSLTAPEAQVRALPLMERVAVLMYRHRVPPEVLRTLAGDSAFAYTIRDGWVDRTAPKEAPALREVRGKGDRAVARDETGADLYFVREDGAWRWDMMPTIRDATAQITAHLPAGMTEDEFIFLVLRNTTGRPAQPTVWQPVQ